MSLSLSFPGILGSWDIGIGISAIERSTALNTMKDINGEGWSDKLRTPHYLVTVERISASVSACRFLFGNFTQLGLRAIIRKAWLGVDTGASCPCRGGRLHL